MAPENNLEAPELAITTNENLPVPNPANGDAWNLDKAELAPVLQSGNRLAIKGWGKPESRISPQVLGLADLAVSQEDDLDPVAPGGELVYTVRVDNCGPSDAPGVVVTDTLPAGVTLIATTGCAEDPVGVPSCTLGSIAEGEFAQHTVAVMVKPEVAPGTVLSNLATVSSDVTDPNPANDSDTEDTLVVGTVADLSVTKEDDPDPVAPGGELIYTIRVDNAGPSDATGVVVADPLPAGVTLNSTTGCAEDPVGAPTCTLGNILAGGFAQYTIAVTVAPEVIPGTVLSNTATVSSNVADPNAANDSDTENTLVPPQISLTLVGTDVVGVSRSPIVEASIPAPAPPGGVNVAVTGDDPSILAVSPPGTAFIPEGATVGPATVNGVSPGTTTLRGNATGFTEGALLVGVTLNLISVPTTLNVPLAQTTALPVTIAPNPAPLGGALIALVSGDPSIVAVLTPTVLIPEGLFSANGTVQGASTGVATVIASNPNYAADSSQVSTTAELNILQSSLTFNSGLSGDLTIQLESGGSASAAPSPGVAVTLTADDADCASASSPVTILTGQINTAATVIYAGIAPLPCSTVVTASAPNVTSDNVNVTINPAPGINMSFLPKTVGAGLIHGTSFRAQLGASNHGGVTVRIESDNPSAVLVSPDSSTPGTASIDVFVPDGQIIASYRFQGVEGATGSANITGSAPGFNSGAGTVNVVQPGLSIESLITSATTLSPDDPFQVVVGIPSGNGVSAQVVRPGGTAPTATITNSDSAVGQLVTTAFTGQMVTVTIPVGASSSPFTVALGGAAFDPLGGGDTTVSATIPGFIATPNATITVTVS